MPIKLVLISFFTLGLLFGFLAVIILSIMYLSGIIDITLLLEFTIGINFIIWIVGPYLTDLIHRIFYKMRFLPREEFKQQYPELEMFIARVCTGNRVPFPKIGLINDDNPTSYTYGSGAFNSRIILTTGLFTYLQAEEIEAVAAHEIGHIVHRDFIIMTIANTIIQLLYEISEIFMRRHSRRSGDRNKDSDYLFFVGLAAFIFYVISFYIVLFLSRIRETYADEFSAKTTGKPANLSNTLIKIAYGIMAKEETRQSMRLLESTRTLGIMGFRTAKEAGLIAKVTNMEPAKVAKVLVYDVVSPWAKLAELASTHPLTGKRLARLDKIAINLGGQPLFNITKTLEENPVDKQKLWSGFFAGAFMYYLPLLTIIALVIIYMLGPLFGLTFATQSAIAVGIGIFSISIILRALYRYPSITKAKNTDVLSLMSDLYATPTKGEPIMLQGTIIGRGIPGYVFSEDMMLQDNSGLMYLDYRVGVPIIGDVIFAWKKVKQLFGQAMNVKGWFFRSNFQYVVLDSLNYDSSKIRSYAKFWNILIGLFLMGAAAVTGATSNLKVLYLPAIIIGLILLVIYGKLRRKNKILTKEEEAQLAETSISWKRVLKAIGIGMAIILLIIFLLVIFLK